MSKSTIEEHNQLRERLCPVVEDGYAQPEKTTSTRLKCKKSLDYIAHLNELARIEQEYIANG